MKKLVHLLLVIGMMLTLISGCGTSESQGDETEEIVVFAAASMTETLTEIAEEYKKVEPEVELVFNFDSSGTLKTQIEEGAECDVFISAAQKQMDEAEKLIIPETRMDLLENKVVLVVPEGNPAGIQSFDDMISGLITRDIMLAIGNADVPVGQYTERIFAFLALNMEEVEGTGCITYGSNAKEVTTQVSENMVDCGILYATDAYSAGLDIVDTATAEMCGQVIYLAAVLNTTEKEEVAKAFLSYLMSEDARAIFEQVGFTPVL